MVLSGRTWRARRITIFVFNPAERPGRAPVRISTSFGADAFMLLKMTSMASHLVLPPSVGLCSGGWHGDVPSSGRLRIKPFFYELDKNG